MPSYSAGDDNFARVGFSTLITFVGDLPSLGAHLNGSISVVGVLCDASASGTLLLVPSLVLLVSLPIIIA